MAANEGAGTQVSRREFVRTALEKTRQAAAVIAVKNISLFVDTGPTTPERESPAENVIQTGLKEMDVGGKKYRIVVSQQAVVDLIQELGKIHYGEDNTAIVMDYLKEHELEIRINNKQDEPLITLATFGSHAGTFIPPDDLPYTPRALIVIPTDTLKEMHFPTNKQEKPTEKNREASLDYNTVFPHELLHFVSYAKSPLEGKIKSYIGRAVKLSEVFLSYLAAKSPEYKGLYRTIKFIQMMILFNLINMFILIPVDEHEPLTNTFSNSHLHDVLENNPRMKSLVFEAIKLVPS